MFYHCSSHPWWRAAYFLTDLKLLVLLLADPLCWVLTFPVECCAPASFCSACAIVSYRCEALSINYTQPRAGKEHRLSWVPNRTMAIRLAAPSTLRQRSRCFYYRRNNYRHRIGTSAAGLSLERIPLTVLVWGPCVVNSSCVW